MAELRAFECLQVEEAVAFAAAGGQAIHLHRIIPDRDRAPACFVRAVDRGEDIAHLFDQDVARLKATARSVGVRVIVVERVGTPNQHVDLCGVPLRRLLAKLSEQRRPAPPKSLF